MPQAKDYYRILHVSPSATGDEIKNAYRKLAKQYHPDRNPGDSLAAAEFADIAEAYTILSDKESRKQYNFSRHLTAPEEYKKPIEQIDTLINRMHEVNHYLKYINEAHFSEETLFYSIIQVLPEDIELLSGTNETKLKIFLETVLQSVQPLHSGHTIKLEEKLHPLFAKNHWFYESIERLKEQQKKSERWEKYKVMLAVLMAIVLCILIFYEGGR
ncbi:MAG: J domain-containing protein [Bacteroidetes bacterium]|nr:J domain-containing protein [Bacteroidota bacterium]